ncbi:isochorismatase hydrolase [Pseudogulbenkiania sp. NH8B]|uniref:cysteine hydrolase family protein n=1 Tax=Pseudogulbenkiania sp. (strain NH8B) TaxID=748280 RepID=UPI0002279E5C|nr:cysteine hydrolase family protein [Pseudogulbenkiania sp. NH8B]BAK76633.1 isochorismatase hydrolase [Pseudogulbenkiania sp. NH8B]
MTASMKRALIVIDVQNEYVTGHLRIEYPAVELSLSHIGQAMDAARAAGIPIVVVQNSAPSGSPIFARGSDGWALHPVVAGRPAEHYVEKTLPSAFAGTDLESWLREQGIDTLTVVGYMTHNCVDSTVKQALHTGFAVEVLDDATGSVPYSNRAGLVSAEMIHRTFMVVLQSRFANVMDTATWLAALAGQPLPERESIYASNQHALQMRARMA